MINGVAHGPEAAITACQLHMRHFHDGDEITIVQHQAVSFERQVGRQLGFGIDGPALQSRIIEGQGAARQGDVRLEQTSDLERVTGKPLVDRHRPGRRL